MTTTDKDFVVKNGLVVQGNQGTINGSVIVTEAALNTSLGDYININEKDVADGVAALDANANVLTKTAVVFEGSTADVYETTLDVTDPTADRTITLPNVSGTVVTTGNQNDAYPSQSGQNGKYLKTDGTNVSWATVSGGGGGETLTIGTGLSGTSYNGSAPVTIAIDSTVATTSGTQTLTNKTLTTPVISTVGGSEGGQIEFGLPATSTTLTTNITVDSYQDKFRIFEGGGSNKGVFINLAGATAGVASELITNDGSQTLTNKTLGASNVLGANLSAATYQITNLGTPSNSTDAATKQYVDDVAQGLHIHASCVAATTSNVNISTGLESGDMLDGVLLVAGNRVLVKNQSTTSQNGIYVVQSSGAAVRASDFDTAAEIQGGDFVFVTGGTVNDNTGWVQVETVTTVGTDPIVFVQFSGAGTYTAGDGLTLTGSQFSVDSTVARINASNTFTANQLISANTSSTALEIRQIGTGNALVVEDETNPDATPFVIDATGAIGIGVAPGTSKINIYDASNANIFMYGEGLVTTTAYRSSTNVTGPVINLRKARGTSASRTAVVASDQLGTINFDGYDGTNGLTAGQIRSLAEGTISTGIVPGVLSFSTANTSGTLTERMRIDSSGNIGIGVTPTTKLDVLGGSIQVRAAATQDGILLSGRAGGTSSFDVTITPTTLTADRTLTLANGDTTLQAGTMAITGGTLAQFAATTSAQLAGVISDETGTDKLVFNTSPTLVTPNIGVASGTSLALTSTTSTSTLFITDTGSNGANIRLLGNGATTPNKYIRAAAGNFSIVNDAYTAEILTLTNAGALSVSSTVSASGLAGSLLTSTVGTALGTAAAGSSAIPARSDHVHPTATTVVATVTGTNGTDLVYGNMADNDQFRIRIGGTATNAGFVEIATADDGTEPIYVRQYTGVFTTLTRTATLLDGSGNTTFPGTVSGTSFNSITGLSSTTPAALGTAAVGTGTTAARADHVHANTGVGVMTGTSFNSITGLASTTPSANSGAGSVGTGTAAARNDHVHPIDATLTIGTGLSGTSYNGSAAVTIANTGVLSINGSTGTVTLSNLTSGTGISFSSGTTYNGSAAITINNSGVTSVNGGTGAVTGIATTGGNLSQFAATTSAQLAGVISDETGSGALVFGTSPTITTPVITLATSAPTFTTNAYTLVAGDAYKILLASNGTTAGTVNIPTDATVNFAVGTQITVLQDNTGQLTITATTPATTTIRSSGATSTSPKLRTRNSSATLIKTAANIWYVIGDIV